MSRSIVSCTPAAAQTSSSYMAIVNSIHTALLAIGLNATADTGQLNLGSSPTLVSNTLVGYRIYELNDSLSGSAPIYICIEFWSFGASFKMAIGVQASKGTDGAGTLTDTFGSMAYSGYSSATARAESYNVYVSRGEGYFLIYFAGDNSVTSTGYMSHPVFFAVERARDLDGDYRGDALLSIKHGTSTATGNVLINFDYAYRYSDAAALGNLHPGTVMMPSVFSSGTGVGGGIVPMFFTPLVFAPGVDPWQPTILAGVPQNDNPGTPFDVSIFGDSHTYTAPAFGAAVSTTSPVYIGITASGIQAPVMAFRWDA